ASGTALFVSSTVADSSGASISSTSSITGTGSRRWKTDGASTRASVFSSCSNWRGIGPADSASCRNPCSCASATAVSGLAVSVAPRAGLSLPYLASDSPGSTMDPAANAAGSMEYSVEGLGRGAESVLTGACEAAVEDCAPCGWYLEIDSPGNKIGS